MSLLSQDMSREYLHQQDAKKMYEVMRLCSFAICICVRDVMCSTLSLLGGIHCAVATCRSQSQVHVSYV